MRLVVGDTVREGRAVDASDLPVSLDAALAAIADAGANATDGGDTEVVVESAAPGPVHEHVGGVTAGMDLSVRSALAAAARSRGVTAPQDDRIETLRERLATFDPEPVSTRKQRRAVAEAGETVEQLRERVAALRGRVRALEEADADAGDARADLSTAVQRLSEAETDRIAAEQRFDAARAAARETRDARDRRLRLEDRLANCEREARSHLIERVAPDFAEAVAAVPGGDTATTAASATTEPLLPDVQPVTGALAVARVADLSAPAVLACDRFETPARAADWLDAPVLSL